MDIMVFMFLYYDRASGIPQMGAIAAMPVIPGVMDIVGIVPNADMYADSDILAHNAVNPTRWAFAGGIPQSLLN